eukprot:5435730-Prymnesium_polylepis.2
MPPLVLPLALPPLLLVARRRVVLGALPQLADHHVARATRQLRHAVVLVRQEDQRVALLPLVRQQLAVGLERLQHAAVDLGGIVSHCVQPAARRLPGQRRPHRVVLDHPEVDVLDVLGDLPVVPIDHDGGVPDAAVQLRQPRLEDALGVQERREPRPARLAPPRAVRGGCRPLCGECPADAVHGVDVFAAEQASHAHGPGSLRRRFIH